jgi:hypothetical protein
MIVKILPPIASFGGVNYNTRKVDRNKGELMKVANFGPLQVFGYIKPQDYINYLKTVSSLNKNVRLPQFHAIISAKGKNYDKATLTTIAESWLKEMGYGDQPYLIVFHKDTGNNHVHMVSTRVRRDGAKINSAYEHVRSQKSIQKVLGYEYAKQYKISTRAQYLLLLEAKGYPGIDPNESLIQEKISRYQTDRSRANEIAGFLKYHLAAGDLITLMKYNYDIELMFHAAEGKKPYGYSIIDHDTKQVFKGSEVLPMRYILNPENDFTGKALTDVINDNTTSDTPAAHIQSISIADDVDDQQIHGMRRRRQRKARTNNR